MKDCTVSGKENKSRLKNECLTIDLPCNPSQRVETVTSHSHSLFPDQEVRDLNNPLEKGGGSEQTSALTPISARDFSTLVKQMGFSFYVDGNGKLLISLSQPSIPKTETQAKNDICFPCWCDKEVKRMFKDADNGNHRNVGEKKSPPANPGVSAVVKIPGNKTDVFSGWNCPEHRDFKLETGKACPLCSGEMEEVT